MNMQRLRFRSLIVWTPDGWREYHRASWWRRVWAHARRRKPMAITWDSQGNATLHLPNR